MSCENALSFNKNQEASWSSSLKDSNLLGGGGRMRLSQNKAVVVSASLLSSPS